MRSKLSNIGLSNVGKALRIIIYLVILVGIACWIYDLYTMRSEWRASLVDMPRIEYSLPTYATIHLDVDVYNPSHSKVRARFVWYSIYVENQFVGEGFEPYIELRPGHNVLHLDAKIDLSRLPCPVLEALYEGRNVTVSIRGYAVIDLMLFGVVSYKQLLVPFNKTVEELEPPTIPEHVKDALKLYVYLCEHRSEVAKLLEKLGGAIWGTR